MPTAGTKLEAQLSHVHRTLAARHQDIADGVPDGLSIHSALVANEPDALLSAGQILLDRLQQLMLRSRWNKRRIAVLVLSPCGTGAQASAGTDVPIAALPWAELASRLQDCLRCGDTIVRLTEVSFGVLLNDLARKEDLDGVIRKIQLAWEAPFAIDGASLRLAAFIGIGICPDEASDAGTLLRQAELALRKARTAAVGNVEYANGRDADNASARRHLEGALRHALKREEFHLSYQPQVSLVTSEIDGFEAYLRCRSMALSHCALQQLLPVLERSGLILPVGQWMLRQACSDLREQQQRFGKSFKVAVNLSLRQFTDAALPGLIAQILQDTGIEPSCLELEITEGMFAERIAETSAILHAIADLGVKLAIDDFGTGYSSLGFLKRLPFSTLKIDQSFIAGIDTGEDDAAIATAIITMAHSMNMAVIAEGVETASQLAFLQKNGCDFAQGYYFARPGGIEDLHRVITRLEERHG